jgi:hypothetical protein
MIVTATSWEFDDSACVMCRDLEIAKINIQCMYVSSPCKRSFNSMHASLMNLYSIQVKLYK